MAFWMSLGRGGLSISHTSCWNSPSGALNRPASLLTWLRREGRRVSYILGIGRVEVWSLVFRVVGYLYRPSKGQCLVFKSDSMTKNSSRKYHVNVLQITMRTLWIDFDLIMPACHLNSRLLLFYSKGKQTLCYKSNSVVFISDVQLVF